MSTDSLAARTTMTWPLRARPTLQSPISTHCAEIVVARCMSQRNNVAGWVIGSELTAKAVHDHSARARPRYSCSQNKRTCKCPTVASQSRACHSDAAQPVSAFAQRRSPSQTRQPAPPSVQHWPQRQQGKHCLPLYPATAHAVAQVG